MKLNKHTLFSTLFFLIFFSAFSSGAYASISNSIKAFSHFSKNKELKEDGNVSASEDLVFEETENDSEESLSPVLILLPDFLDLNTFIRVLNNKFTEFTYSEKFSNSIFLSIRALRI